MAEKSAKKKTSGTTPLEEKFICLSDEKVDLREKIAGLERRVEELTLAEVRTEKLRSVIEINTYITHSLEKDDVLGRILDQIKKLLDCELSSILLVDEELQCLRFAFLSKEEDADRLKTASLKMGEGIAGTVWDNGTPVIINDAQSDSRFSSMGDRRTNLTTRNIIAVPLTVNGLITGVIEAINKRAGSFSDFDLQLLQYISTQSAIAIKNADLYDMAIRDGMTKLFIHKYFKKRLDEEWKRSWRYAKNLALVMFDIDHFKGLNDTYGHQAGDRVIKEVAGIIQGQCRVMDIACRYGGEEFAVILPETSCSEALKYTERVRSTIERMRINHDDAILQFTVSCGLCSIPDVKPQDMEEFIEMCDTALYHSKHNGRNRYTLFSPDLLVK